MLMGERIYLNLMEEKDIPDKVRWINDPEISQTLTLGYPLSIIGTKKWLDSVASDSSRRDFIVFLIENDLPIGYGGFINIDFKNSKAETYMAIGQKEYWGKGYAGDIRRTLTEYAFKELGLNLIYSYVWSRNEKMINLNKKFGFSTDAVLKDDIYSHGEFRSTCVMSLLKREYEEREIHIEANRDSLV
ncbi:GNAT family protein [Bacillota bacterium]